MADLASIIARKETNDAEWKAGREAERKNVYALQDTAVSYIVSQPDAYARYLDLQAENPMYSAGNVALSMIQNEGGTMFGTKEKWRAMGRSVLTAEENKGFQILARGSFGKGTVITDAYDISQTTGKEVNPIRISGDSREMDQAMMTLLNFSAVPVKPNEGLETPALYDERDMILYVNPHSSDKVAFSAIAAEVAHSRFHNKGQNEYYNKVECELDAQSVSYILCRRFGIPCEQPDASDLGTLYESWTPDEARRGLDGIQQMQKKIGSAIEYNLGPQEHTRSSIARRVPGR